MLSKMKGGLLGLCAVLALLLPAAAAAPVDTRSAATLRSSEDNSIGADGSAALEFSVEATPDPATAQDGSLGASVPSKGKIKVSSVDENGKVVKEQFLAIGDSKPGDARDANSSYVCAVDSEDDAAVFQFTRSWMGGTYSISVAENGMEENKSEDWAVDWFVGVHNELPDDVLSTGEPRLIVVKDGIEAAMWKFTSSSDKSGLVMNLSMNRDPTGPFRGVYVTVPSAAEARGDSSSYVAVTRSMGSAALVEVEESS